MSYFVIVRGPLGIGKSTIAKKLTKILKAKYISMDEIVDKNLVTNKPDKNGMMDVKNFIRANKLIQPITFKSFKKNKSVITDGCFYHKEQIVDIIDKLKPYKVYIFDLKASINICIERDKKRKVSIGKDATKAVYNAVSKFSVGIKIDNSKKISN